MARVTANDPQAWLVWCRNFEEIEDYKFGRARVAVPPRTSASGSPAMVNRCAVDYWDTERKMWCRPKWCSHHARRWHLRMDARSVALHGREAIGHKRLAASAVATPMPDPFTPNAQGRSVAGTRNILRALHAMFEDAITDEAWTSTP
jgi:hypothetical protein